MLYKVLCYPNTYWCQYIPCAFFTVSTIAVALVSISFQLSQTNMINEAYAKGSYSRCDNSNVRNNPCYVHIVNYEDQKNYAYPPKE